MATKQTKKKAVKPAAKAAQTAKKPVAKKCAAKRPNGAQAPKNKAKTPTNKAIAPKKNIFDGASEIALTENKIVVTRTQKINKNGRYENRTVREYLDHTPENAEAFNRKLASASPKKISVKLK